MKILPLNFYNYQINTRKQPPKFAQAPLFDTVSFGGKRKIDVKKAILNLEPENFPSSGLREFLIENLTNPENKKEFLELHQQYYSRLADCKTLKEAKELYPEFEKTIDAQDLYSENGKNMDIISRAKAGELENTGLEDLTLALIKKYYLELVPLADKAQYFCLRYQITTKLLGKLNIKMPKEYRKILQSEVVSNSAKKQWETEEMRQSVSDYWTSERRSEESERSKIKWHTDSYREKQDASWTPERRQKRSETSSRIMRETLENDPEFYVRISKSWTSEKRQAAREAKIEMWNENTDDPIHNAAVRLKKEEASLRSQILWKQPQYIERQEKSWTPERRKRASEIMTELMSRLWNEPEFILLMEELHQKLANDPKYLKKASETSKQLWQDPTYIAKQEAARTPERAEKASEKSRQLWQDPNYIAKQEASRTPERAAKTSESLRKQHATPEGLMYRKLVGAATSEAWRRHPEFSQMYSEVAKKYPGLPDIIIKERAGIKLNDAEKRHAGSFFKECSDKFPQVNSIISNLREQILKEEWGVSKKDPEGMQSALDTLGLQI